MGFHLRVLFFFLLQTCLFYILILISTVTKLRRMQIQISNIINGMNKHNKRGYTYSFQVRHLEYVINYSFLRHLRNLHRKPQVTRNFATLIPIYEVFDCKIFKSFSLHCSLLLTMVISLEYFTIYNIEKTNSCIDSFIFYLYKYHLFLVSICHERY